MNRILKQLWLPICAATALFLQEDCFAAQRVGVQAVVFPRWNSTSVRNMVNAVNSASPAEFELSQVPFFGSSNRWDNTVNFLGGLTPNIRVVGTFFGSFHTDQSGYDLGKRALELNKFLVTPKLALGNQAPVARLSRVVISPQLEDRWNDTTWIAKSRTMLDQMDENAVLRSGKLELRRSVLSQPTSLRTLTYKRGTRTYTFPVVVERHGVSSRPSQGVWSNDGDFVYREATIAGVRETKASMVDETGAAKTTMTLARFSSESRATAAAVNLWRPAYNLWPRTTSGGRVTWTRRINGTQAWNRVDSYTAFDDREARVLREFIANAR